MIKRIAQTAGFTGLLAALLLTLLQSLWVAPLILQAETYEKPAASEVHEHADMAMPAHEHDAEAWEPEDGWQRVLSTTGGNLVVAVGFALMLAGLLVGRLVPALGPALSAVEIDGVSPTDIVKQLLARRIVASTSPYAVSYARLAPSLVNTPAEVDEALRAVRAIAG